jgi:hypothetical protein
MNDTIALERRPAANVDLLLADLSLRQPEDALPQLAKASGHASPVRAPRIDLGTAVRISVSGRPGTARTEEGVVIEVVPRHVVPRSVHLLADRHRDHAERFVVQCDGHRAVLLIRELLVVAI